MGKIRGTHTSPGFYSKITDLTYKANSIGITTAGLVGETLKGPAFDPIWITSKQEFADYFGGTSAEKYKDSQYPRYELPYIANSYLSASDQLYVCRVLGLSGYNAGPAFILTADKKGETTKYVIGVLRSRGSFITTGGKKSICDPDATNKYDTVDFRCAKIELKPYTSVEMAIACEGVEVKENESDFSCTALNLGRFTIVCQDSEGNEIGRYPVSLNAGEKDYIYKVLGSKPSDGSAAVYVEELYDNYLIDLIETGKVDEISSDITLEKAKNVIAVSEPVKSFLSIPYDELSRKQLGQSFVADSTEFKVAQDTPAILGQIYKVVKNGTVYEYQDTKLNASGKSGETDNYVAVQVLDHDAFYYVSNGKLVPVVSMSDYHEMYRCATTPWVVSEQKGPHEVKKLFRFHTISDGDCANSQVKISIANIRPDEGTFDVYVRDYSDSDANPTILESYRGLTMVPGTSKYIGLQIGTIDGAYECKSKYVMLEIIENDMTEQCVPGGFLGYPVRTYGENYEAPSFVYNKVYDEDVKAKRQYFGLSDITGVDYDMLSYKGKNAYTENYASGYTHGFHLDSSLVMEYSAGNSAGTIVNVTVDGESGITFDTVNPNNGDSAPILGSDAIMEGTIYEDVNLRKFTLYPYGGFDGWDIYRNVRTTSNDYKANRYKGYIANGHGSVFSKIQDSTALSLTGNCITSDYYAWLAGAKQFDNPEKFKINLLATPGIDYVNDTMLSDEILSLVEDRQDTLYIMTTPDKPKGATDAVDEMYSSSDAAGNLEDAGIDSYYAATYYPWVKYFDKDNNVYINLPATKDALKSMANVDNKKFPWYAPAGTERGTVDCAKMHFFAKTEDEDNVYNGRINPLKTFSKEGVLIWGNKTMYSQDTPMNRINTVRLMLYMRKLISEAVLSLIFEPNDTTLKGEFESIINSILSDIKSKRGITDFKLQASQTAEQMDAHELSGKLWVKPLPTLEYIEIEFVVTPQGVSFED